MHLGTLHTYLTALISHELASDVDKLAAVRGSTERHLYLFGRDCPHAEYFARLSDLRDDGSREDVGSLTLPEELTDVWFQGRMIVVNDDMRSYATHVARFNYIHGWSRHVVELHETSLPAPPPPFDQLHIERNPKNRAPWSPQ